MWSTEQHNKTTENTEHTEKKMGSFTAHNIIYFFVSSVVNYNRNWNRVLNRTVG